MSKGNTTETDLLNLIFNATALPWASNTNLFIALHSADPGEGGTQLTNEVVYTGYARVTVARSNVGFTVAGNLTSNAALVAFPQCTALSTTATHVSVGTAASGAGQILYKGALSTPVAISAPIQPIFNADSLTVSED